MLYMTHALHSHNELKLTVYDMKCEIGRVFGRRVLYCVFYLSQITEQIDMKLALVFDSVATHSFISIDFTYSCDFIFYVTQIFHAHMLFFSLSSKELKISINNFCKWNWSSLSIAFFNSVNWRNTRTCWDSLK